jgi:uncharacterized protein YndB with AHSA1/START domain
MGKAVFTKDIENHRMTVEKIFDAPREKVWRAYTESDILDQWWAPKPWTSETKRFDFREGGQWLYAMVSPEGQKFWAIIDYGAIEPGVSFVADDSFCDEEGNKNNDIPSTHWKDEFFEEDGKTQVVHTLTFTDKAAMETIIKMGFEEGFTMGIGNLEELLPSL